MGAPRQPRNRQAELFARSKRPVIAIAENHRLVLVAMQAGWWCRLGSGSVLLMG